MIGQALGRPARLLPVPPRVLRLMLPPPARTRLLESLSVDISRLARHTGYRAPHSVEEGLRATAEWYRAVTGTRAAR
jgi:UDP-glucose 4-epimerase